MRNFRDVGGLPVAAGGQLARAVLYRADAPRFGDDPLAGVSWPPATVIDLRSQDELTRKHPLAEQGADVHAVALMARAGIAHLVEQPHEVDDGLGALYVRMLKGAGGAIGSIPRLIGASNGATLVHCTAGKDRTGLVLAVVLSAAGVAREHVVADYVGTQENMEGIVARVASTPGLTDAPELVRRIAQRRPEIFTAPAEAIGAALDFLDEAGGAEAWLKLHGATDAELSRMRARLVWFSK
jgi:protein-tyrosine phosphatase